MLNEAAQIIDVMYGPPMTVLSDCIRGFLIAKPGHDLIACDFSNIEGRVLAWLANEKWKVKAFYDFDNDIGHDIYKLSASGIYNKSIKDISLEERQIGKVAELALGFGGGKGAFQMMAKGYGVKVSDEIAETIKLAWREKHPNIVRFWYALENAAMSAVLNPGTTTKVDKIKYKKAGSFLFCLLPSNRAICYPYPEIKEVMTPWGKPKDALTYMGEDSLTKKWERQTGYGGLLSENVTQSVARDILTEAMFRVEDANYPIVMHVHDEIVTEVEENFGDKDDLEKIMSENCIWNQGLPIAVEGWRGKRYRK